MNKTKLISLFTFITLIVSAQFKPIEITGKIGKYPIEIIITQFNKDSAKFTGKYNYTGKKNYLKITGLVKGNCLEITESYNGKTTGYFYLSKETTDSLKGWWKNDTKEPMGVLLKFKNSLLSNQLKTNTIEDKNKTVNETINGKYTTETYFINDLFFPNIEIAYNGGSANFKKVGKDSLKFQLEMICGPTYHLAYAEGYAIKKGNDYIYKDNQYTEKGEFCEIKFVFKNKTVYAEANSSMNCGFGARAYLEHTLLKVYNSYKFISN